MLKLYILLTMISALIDCTESIAISSIRCTLKSVPSEIRPSIKFVQILKTLIKFSSPTIANPLPCLVSNGLGILVISSIMFFLERFSLF